MVPAIAGTVPERLGMLRTLLVFADSGRMREPGRAARRDSGPDGLLGMVPPETMPAIAGMLLGDTIPARRFWLRREIVSKHPTVTLHADGDQVTWRGLARQNATMGSLSEPSTVRGQSR